MDPGARDRACAAACGEVERSERLELRCEAEGETGREAVAGAVRVGRVGRKRRSLIRTARLRPAAERARRRDDDAWLRVELPRVVELGLVLPARDERVELDGALSQRREFACGRHEDA